MNLSIGAAMMCGTKRQYDRRGAKEQAQAMRNGGKHKFPKARAYECPICQHWHVTKGVKR